MVVSLGSIIKGYQRAAQGSSRALPPQDISGVFFPWCVFVGIGKYGF